MSLKDIGWLVYKKNVSTILSIMNILEKILNIYVYTDIEHLLEAEVLTEVLC